MSESDWYLPGAFVVDGERRVYLHPPPSCERVILEIPRVPPSMNQNAIRSHWRGFQSEKKSWQTEIETLLMVHKVRREAYQRAAAGCIMRFAARASRRDPSNFAGVVNKALGDALTNFGAIPDDDAPHYLFAGVEFEEEMGAARTQIHLFLQPKEG